VHSSKSSGLLAHELPRFWAEPPLTAEPVKLIDIVKAYVYIVDPRGVPSHISVHPVAAQLLRNTLENPAAQYSPPQAWPQYGSCPSPEIETAQNTLFTLSCLRRPGTRPLNSH